jgi:small-conductance mechanosensitive channel
MELSQQTLENLILPAGLLVSGIILGFIVEKIFLLKIKKTAISSRWEGGSVIIHSLKGITFLWFVAAGIYGALLNLDFIGPKLSAHIKMGLMVILILSITILIAKLTTGFVKLYTGRILPSTSIFTNLSRVFIYLLGMLVLLQTLGVSVAPIITALGIGGLAVALALQDTLSNLFAGLHIIASRKIKPGDYIRLETGAEGFLEDITLRNTSIRTVFNTIIIVPNSKIASSILTNYSIPTKDYDMFVPVGVSYSSDLENVEKITIEVGKEVLDKLERNVVDPVIRYSAFADSSINFNVVLRVKEFADQGLIRHEFIKKLQKRYQQEGIEIPFPIRTVHLHNTN